MDETAKIERKSNGRVAAFACFGLALACVVARASLGARKPDIALLPLTAAGILACLGLFLLLRGVFAGRTRSKSDEPEATVQIAPYSPEMSDGSDGAEAVQAVLAPLSKIGEPAECEASRTAPRAPRGRAVSRKRVAAQRLGSEWSNDLQLSPRAQARLEADPFVQRLARLA
ncbi:hypothetical protein R3X27_05705 [Tropicimonas sp. TH_r6]|uniref:hypothetical protein n=1 Tax=Tropicimonas sp. TH_r6 TaxID=3082085 RepID=UPI002955CC8F|nr:hypothetical protein [Tropicimonas sp. TH_r6]MDV7142170.1 hypothetical protein [Tropicimonas sp. TH_r6]